ncbi:MAG: TraB/GumN family protein [Gammaproteobacteria bacterium]|jgi:pheromone shutdown-related protein TraB
MSNPEQEPIKTIKLKNAEVTLLGTAHISRASADKVKELLESGHYDSVAVELCPSRHNAIINPDALAKMDLFQVIRQGKASLVAANLALGAFQQRMAEQLDIKPGAEMRVAIDTATEMKIPVSLIDREISVTLKRVYRNVPWWQRMNIVAGLFASVISRQEVSEEEIEKLKEGDILESAFSQFAQEAEHLYKPLVDERDQYMAARLMQEDEPGDYQRILAVVGAGHLKGIASYLSQWQTSQDPSHAQTTLSHLDEVPPGSKWIKFIPWAIVALIFVGFIIGFSRSSELGLQLVLDWVLINGGLCALGTLIAFGHPFTVIGAFLAAPLTSLNPTIGAGMVTAAIETYMRKPTVEDFSNLRSDTTHLKGWWGNRVTRVLLVFILSTLGSAAGTYLAGFRIFERLTGS